RLDPVYPAVEGIGPASLARLVGKALERLPPAEALELLPAGLRERLDLPPLRGGLLSLPQPPPGGALAALAPRPHPAPPRVGLGGLLAHHLSLRRQRIALRRHGAMPVRAPGKLAAALRQRLAFALTGAQQRVLDEIRRDMARPEPMLRLVQGDVGSGKTVVAALAAVDARSEE